MKLFTILLNIAKRIKTAFSRLTTLETWQSDTADYIVECYNGTNEGYTKWTSGKCEVWKRIEKSLSTPTLWNTPIYYGAYVDNSITYTMTGFNGFISLPTVTISIQSTGGNVFVLCGNKGSGTETTFGSYYVYSVGKQTNMSAFINLYAVGKWK